MRRIPLFPKLKALLLEIRSKSQSPDSEIIKIKNARKALETACAKTGIGPYTQHSLRHYFASEAVEKNIDFKTIGASWDIKIAASWLLYLCSSSK